jgi:hypothetical protein
VPGVRGSLSGGPSVPLAPSRAFRVRRLAETMRPPLNPIRHWQAPTFRCALLASLFEIYLHSRCTASAGLWHLRCVMAGLL